MAVLIYLVYAVVTLISYFILSTIAKYRKDAKYFKKNDIPFLGMGLKRIAKFFTASTTLVDMELEIYQEAKATNAPIVGMSDIFGDINLYIMDLDVAKNIYVKDFDHFVNHRSFGSPETSKYFSKMLFAMESEPWKAVRAKLSPSFTTSKIRKMFDILRQSSDRMEIYVKDQIKPGVKSIDLNFSQIFPKYAMDVIANCAFGIDSKCFEVPPDKKSTFEQKGTDLQFGFKSMIKAMLMLMFPKPAEMLGVEFMDTGACQYFDGAIKSVMNKRRETGERREDFLQLMMDAQAGLLKEDDESNLVMNGSAEGGLTSTVKVKFDDDYVAANAMLFMLAGFDTTQSVLIFTTYCLALEAEVQQKVFEEVETAKGKHGGKISYEAILEMTYLDLVIQETMRLYPPSVSTDRVCTRDYTVPGTNFVIKKGNTCALPIHACHLDERYFPDPHKFIPERFTAEAKANRNPYAYAPFGHGPRNCIGMRFALIKVKAVIATMVSKYQLSPCSKTNIPVQFEGGANLRPKGGCWLNVAPRT